MGHTGAIVPEERLRGRSSPLHHAEPFGTVDPIVLVDTEAELPTASGGEAAGGTSRSITSCSDKPLTSRDASR